MNNKAISSIIVLGILVTVIVVGAISYSAIAKSAALKPTASEPTAPKPEPIIIKVSEPIPQPTTTAIQATMTAIIDECNSVDNSNCVSTSSQPQIFDFSRLQSIFNPATKAKIDHYNFRITAKATQQAIADFGYKIMVNIFDSTGTSVYSNLWDSYVPSIPLATAETTPLFIILKASEFDSKLAVGTYKMEVKINVVSGVNSLTVVATKSISKEADQNIIPQDATFTFTPASYGITWVKIAPEKTMQVGFIAPMRNAWSFDAFFFVRDTNGKEIAWSQESGSQDYVGIMQLEPYCSAKVPADAYNGLTTCSGPTPAKVFSSGTYKISLLHSSGGGCGTGHDITGHTYSGYCVYSVVVNVP
ncbi:MAG: hypothetical protein AAB922_04135 [Patescibacteria group bacterium]